jgi:hypothetical protein
MAKAKIKFPNSFLTKIGELQQNLKVTVIANVLKCGIHAAYPIVKRSLINSIGRGKHRYETGELVNSLGISPIREVNGKYDLKIGFAEPRRVQTPPKIEKKLRGGAGVTPMRSYYKATNAMIANILEYGARSKGHNQPARPWLRPAILQAELKTVKAMQNEFERTLKKYFE